MWNETHKEMLKLQRWLYWCEHLKYVRNVYCVATNHRWDLHTTETTGNDSFRSVMEQIIFVLFKDTNCLIRNLKHRCSPRSVPRTASSTSFDFRKKSFRSQRDATATSFPCNDISHEDNKKWTIVMFSFLIAQSLLIFFCRTRGFDLCGLTIEPSNYCCWQSPLIARSQTGKTANQIQHVWNDWHIAQSKQSNFRYSFQNIILLFLWKYLRI